MTASQFIVQGGAPLSGTVRPSGNKNAALPIICAALLTDQPVTLENVPRIRDVETLVELVASTGADISWEARNTLHVHAKTVRAASLDPVLCRKIRASILLAGPLLARCGQIELPPPGGDVIGRRRVDTHFLALERLGASFDLTDNFRLTHPRAPRRGRVSRRAERHRHRERDHGGRRRDGHDDPPQRRLRAARPGSLPLSRHARRPYRGDRHEPPHDSRRPGRSKAERTESARITSRSDRSSGSPRSRGPPSASPTPAWSTFDRR